MTITTVLLVSAAIFWYIIRSYNKDWVQPKEAFPPQWRTILNKKVSFYKRLKPAQKRLFEYKIQEFLQNVAIVGIETEVDVDDKLLVASSAVIPIFAFPEWQYQNLDEVLLYANRFNLDFETAGDDRNILGMVGTGYMERKMILSKQALHLGFQNETDKRNTAIHEFVHLIDKADGKVDGIPSVLLEHQYTIPWVDMIERKIEEILAQKSDIIKTATLSTLVILSTSSSWLTIVRF